MVNRVEFVVEYFVPGESGRFTVIGRCGNQPVRVGDVFDVIYRNRPRRSLEELGDEPVREVERPVSLRVVCAHAYGKSLSLLGQGMTGSLVLEGDGLKYLAPGWILGKAAPLQGPVEVGACSVAD